ncbi:MAG: acetoacetate--CoA ligase [Actinobacteria bacterium]|nr:acetoacetate--CoA ligase [Actinomycetota bacterium]
MARVWTPRVDAVEHSNMHRFLETIGAADSDAARRFALADTGSFWNHVWTFCGMQGERGGRTTLVHEPGPRGTAFFPDATLNVVDTLLRIREGDETRAAIIEVDEEGGRRTATWDELRREVGQVAAALTKDGVGPGHRVAAWMPNVRETVVFFLATMHVGATFTSTSADFGAHGVLERFGQTKPTVLLASSHYRYAGKDIDLANTLARVRAGLPGLVRSVVVGDCPNGATPWSDYRGPADDGPRPQFGFDHPGTILYTSGTTGKPKCIVHRAAGVLLMHLKEQQLHCDVRPGDRVFYFTTCGWMMWNWLVSMLASGATIVLYDGSPTHPRVDRLWDTCEEERLTLFGTSAKYIDAMRKSDVAPLAARDLSALRTVCSTGSPLAPDGFDWVRHRLGEVHLASISGGTDLCGCFVGGDPTKPVVRGEIQGTMLGMDVRVVDDDGQGVVDQVGELVCANAFPSVPLGFWEDDGSRFESAYFTRFPGLWRHGDFATQTSSGGFVIHGRSDATLNVAGVRIGTAELYAVVEQDADVVECLAVGQSWENDTRIVLFVVPAVGKQLDDELRERIRHLIRSRLTPRHVPSLVVEVPELPRTRSGKLSELAVADVVNGRAVRNTEALTNPECLVNFTL